jgi:hypothetical protein
LPRSGHAWTRGGNAGGVYLFGGEFSSPKQGTFYHYNDFWRLEPSSREWTRIEAKGKGPPARSGHRMTYYKNYIILFGGFQDTSQNTKYLQDLWLYDTHNYTWHSPNISTASQKPDARSSFSLLPHESGAVLYGGYSRVKATTAMSSNNKIAAKRQALKPMVHQDAWFLRITPPASDGPANALPTVRWERRKRPANAPNPPRAGATMAYHKSRGICFGGVHDVEESEEGMDSEFFDTLFAWNIDRNRFFPLTLRRPKTGAKKPVQADRGGKRGRGKADEEELLRNLARLETKGNLEGNNKNEDMDADVSETKEEETPKIEQPILHAMPHPRFNAQLAVQDDVLYIFSGTYENGDREITFDEMHAIDLGRLDGVKQIFHREPENWLGSEDGSSEEEDEEDEEGYSDEDDGEKMDLDSQEPATPSTIPSSIAGTEISSATTADTEIEEESTAPSASDNKPYPRPFESLRDFYARTSTEWQELVISEMKDRSAGAVSNSVKELKKMGFDRAEERWWDVREEIMAMEDEQEQAGIGEVVNLGDKITSAGGVGRRR